MSFLRWQRVRIARLVSILGVVAAIAWWVPSPIAGAATRAERRREADQLIEEALSREIYGLDDQRQQLLSCALQLAPDHPAARWHTGQVRIGNEWFFTDDYREPEGMRRRRQQYRRQRAGAADTAAGQWALANWCADHQLPLEERAHLNRVVQLAPDHGGARARLGFVRAGGDWARRQDLWQGMRDVESAARSVRKWRPVLEKICRGLRQENPRLRAAAERKLLAITAPDAAVALESLVATQSESAALLAVRALGAMPGLECSRGLTRLAVLSPWPAARQAAAKQLRLRARDHYVPMLLGELATPITSRIQAAVSGGRILYRHVLEQQTQQRRDVAVLDTALVRRANWVPGDPNDFIIPAAARQAETTARALFDLQSLAGAREWQRLQQNALILQWNDRIQRALSTATGQDLPASPEAWWDWWNEENGVRFDGEKPTRTRYDQRLLVYQDVAPVMPSGSEPPDTPRPEMRTRHECFVAGTPVWTIDGPVDIDKIQVGDLVLSQSIQTGELAYKPVLRTTTRPAESLVKVRLATLDRQTLEGSGGHPLWVAGEGWVCLRNLRSGMVLHGVGGTAMISEVEKGNVQETYNLIVDDFHTYVVGMQKILCHDNTARRPTDAIVPGLLRR